MLTLKAVVQTQIILNAQVTQKSVVVPENTKKLHKLVLANCKLKSCEMAEELKISEGSVFTILHEHLSMRNLCSKFAHSHSRTTCRQFRALFATVSM